MKLTRRQWGTALATAATAAAQQPSAPTAPADDLTVARDRLRANARALSATEIPMATEPAFQFKA